MGCGGQYRISGVCKCVTALSCVDVCCLDVAEKEITKSKTKTAAVEGSQDGEGAVAQASQSQTPS